MSNLLRLPIGSIYAISAHVLWGLFPLYWKLLSDIQPLPLVCHRIVWSFVVLSLMVPFLWRGNSDPTQIQPSTHLRDRKIWLVYGFAGILLAINWLAFLWAVNNGAILQASLGYYINPLISVLLGVVLLGERLAALHWLAIAIVTAGVAVMTVAGGGLPWVSLAMAVSFSLYALVKKGGRLPSLPGLWVEMMVLAPISLGYLFYIESQGSGAMRTAPPITWMLLFGGGFVTVLPLALFSSAAKTVSLSMMGILQYVGPTLQFLVGVLIFREDFSSGRMWGFALVWLGVGLYLSHSFRSSRPHGKKRL